MLDTLFASAVRQSPCGYIKSLRDQGYQDVGADIFTTYFAKVDGEDVIAISLDTDWAPLFYDYCQNNPNNPLLPTIYEVETYPGFCVARMEKLITLENAALNAAARDVFEQQGPQWVSYIRGEIDLPPHQENKGFIDSTIQKILSLSRALYEQSGKKILPYCDCSLGNVFLREAQGNYQTVYGAPLFPSREGKHWADNVELMERVFDRFGVRAKRAEPAFDSVG